ncbi:primary replicative DNA helicase [Coriobacterium glomerans PW2]|uniref:Replicative DNA helicase n=1 Tax=Coriobacterium glomerans (strain ATCC 49209 / DSM 20642 / JCM 10262 / PW2) TaxID=700015 RepID=F2N9C4_CORGP|nr:replicative DNA helicase [Coriobacterium glomerans]AEB07872.1 primary replicative DNA helicase [Coriobacterium glomerans PW2]
MDVASTDYAWAPSTFVDRGSRQGLPNNPEAEANVLAAMILSGDVVEDATVELVPDDFYRPAHRTLFMAMQDMSARSLPIDSISLIDYLRSIDKLAAIGGEAYVLELIGQTLALVNWQHHAGIVRRDAMLREIIGATNQINALAFDAPLDTHEVIERAEGMLLSVTAREVKSSFQPLTAFMAEAYAEAEEVSLAGGVAQGVPTDFPSLDRLLLGLREGQLIIVGARPAVGKTSFSLNLALNAAAAGYRVGFFSLEMSGKEIAQRLICAQAMISISDFRCGNIRAEQWASINEATRDLSNLDILIDDTPGTTITEVRAKARRMLHNHERAVIILDYLQLVSPPPGRRAENRAVEVSEMSRALKIMAKDLKAPVIALSQLSRAVESRTGKRPQLSDLRESGSIEQDADIVMFLDRSSDEQEAQRPDRPDTGVTRIIVAKNRSGPTGEVDLMFIPASTKFYELDGVHGEV